MSNDNSAAAASIAAADKRLDNLSVLCGILAGGIDRARRNLRQIRTDSATVQDREQKGHVAASSISTDMLAG